MELNDSFESKGKGNLGQIDKVNNLIPSKIHEELTDLIENNLNHQVINQCCKELGIPHEQLLSRSLNDFQDLASKQTAAIRYQHYEARRKACIQVISSYIQNHGLLSLNSKSYRSQSAGPKSKEKPSIIPCVPISPRQVTARKLKIAKQAIIRRIKVEQKKQKLTQAQEEERSLKEKALITKLSKPVKKDTNKRFFQTHEKRIQEILKKKHQDLQEREVKALETPEPRKEETRNNSFFYSQRRSVAVRIDDKEVEHKLSKINSRLFSSAERAKKNLNKKSNPGHNNSVIIEKVQHKKEELENKEEANLLRKIHKIQNDLNQSNVRTKQKRREEIYSSQQQKRARSSKAIEIRHVEEQLKIQQEIYEKEKNIEIKQERYEKNILNRRERIERTAQAISTRNFLRKQEQEKNLMKVNKSFIEFRNSLIQKIRASEVKVKNVIDYNKLKTAVEKEMKRAQEMEDQEDV